VVEFLCVRSQDHWYNLSRKRGPTGKTYYTTDGDRRIKRHNTHGIEYWKQGDKDYYPDINDIDYDPAKEPATEQTLIPAEEQEFLSEGLHHIATIKGKNPLHERPLILLQAIAQHAVAGGSFDTSTEPFAALELTLSEIQGMSGLSANIQITGNNQNTGNGGSIIGRAPEPFSGDRSISKAFLHRFKTWANLNAEQSIFKDQFRKCTLFLTYIIGPNVDDWVFACADEASQNRTDPQLWRALRTAFKEAFTDTGEKVISLSKLENHKMIGGNVDKYIAGFN